MHTPTDGPKFRALRKRHRITLAALSEDSGLDTSTIYRIEEGLVDPKMGTWSRLIASLNKLAARSTQAAS